MEIHLSRHIKYIFTLFLLHLQLLYTCSCTLRLCFFLLYCTNMLRAVFFVSLFFLGVVQAGCEPHPDCELTNFARCVRAEERCNSPYFRGPLRILKPAIKREKDCRKCGSVCTDMARGMSDYRNRRERLKAASVRCQHARDVAEYHICIETRNGCFFHWEFPTEIKVAACRKCDRVCNHVAPNLSPIHDRRIGAFRAAHSCHNRAVDLCQHIEQAKNEIWDNACDDLSRR